MDAGNNFSEDNLACLESHHPQAWHLLTRSSLEAKGEVVTSANGQPNLSLADAQGQIICLHDEKDPADDVLPFLRLVPENAQGTVILLGMGLGHAALQLLRLRPDIRKFIIYERDPGIFLQALHNVDLAPLLSDPRCLLGVGPEAGIEVLQPAGKALQLEAAYILNHLPSVNLDPEGYQQLYDKIYGFSNSLNMEGATLSHFGKAFIANRLSNLATMRHHFLLEGLSGLFKDVPAVLVAGGPSLNKNVHLLPKLAGRAVIIAGDSVVPVLLQHGVTPTFITSIDPQELTFEKFAPISFTAEKTSLICMPWVTPKVPRIYPAEHVFWTFSASAIESWLNAQLGGTLTTGGAGSMAHLSLLAAIIMGCSPIIFTGQDLAFSDQKQTHADGIVFRGAPPNTSAEQNNPDMLWVEGVNGGQVMTNRAFYGMKVFFEKIISENNGLYINATEGGAHIKGTEVMTLREARERFCRKPSGIDEKISSACCSDHTIQTDKLQREMRKLNDQGKKIITLSNRSGRLSTTIRAALKRMQERGENRQAFQELPPRLQQEISELEGANKKLDQRSTLMTLLQELTVDSLRRSERMLHEIETLSQDPKNYLTWLIKNIDRVDFINQQRQLVISQFLKGSTEYFKYLNNEKSLSKKSAKTPDNENWLKLVRFHLEAGNIALAQTILKQTDLSGVDAKDLCFLRGTIALHQKQFARANEFFAALEKEGDEFRKQILRVRRGCGDRYRRLVDQFRRSNPVLAQKFLFLGIGSDPTNEHLLKELQAAAERDRATLQEAAVDNQIGEHQDIVRGWHELLLTCPQHILPPETGSFFHQCYALLMRQAGDLQAAREGLTAALALTPSMPLLHIRLMELLFEEGDFSQGIKHLDKAVALDRSYAKYWEEIGDTLQQASQAQEAISAYEKCFSALPDHVAILQKIGDCYRAMGQLEAAAEAYRQFLEMAKKLDAASCPGREI